MIKFFRAIRRRLLSENRLTRYLVYAFGEIILVVIGILIALQINIWNEEKKVNAAIGKHLVILRENLEEDRKRLEELQQAMSDNFRYSDSLMQQFKTLIPVDDGTTKYLGKLLLEYQFSPNTNAYETIKQSNEIPFLKPELRTAILDYYALIARAREREVISNTQIQSKYEPYIDNHYPVIFQKNNQWEFLKERYQDDPRPVVELDQEKFLQDKTLEALVTSRYYQCQTLEEFYAGLIASSDQILRLIREK